MGPRLLTCLQLYLLDTYREEFAELLFNFIIGILFFRLFTFLFLSLRFFHFGLLLLVLRSRFLGAVLAGE